MTLAELLSAGGAHPIAVGDGFVETRKVLSTPSDQSFGVAAALDALKPEDIHAMKQGSVRARETLNAEVEMGKVVALYDRLLTEIA